MRNRFAVPLCVLMLAAMVAAIPISARIATGHWEIAEFDHFGSLDAGLWLIGLWAVIGAAFKWWLKESD